MNGYWRFANVLLLAALCGCAHDALLREETQKFVEVARKSETAGTAFYDGIIAKDREIWVFLHRVDPDCKPKPLGESYSDESDENPLNFCRSTKRNDIDVPILAFTRDNFASRYAALEFIDSYLQALADVSQDPTLDGSENFKSAAAKLNHLLQALEKEQVSDARISAVSDLAGMLKQLSEDRESARAIRSIAGEKSKRVDADFKQLINWLEKDEVKKTAQNSRFDGILSQVSDSNQNVGLEARRMWIENSFQKIDREQKVTQCSRDASAETIDGTSFSQRSLCGKTAAGSMLAGWQAHKDFVSLIDGNLSKKQKAHLLSLHREKFFRILKLYVDFAGVF
jgi:hypothetical protein